MPASHIYASTGTTESAKGYEAWVSSREKEETSYVSNGAFSEAGCNQKVFGAAEATKGYSNMQQAMGKKEDNMIVKHSVSSEDEDCDEKVFAAAEATKGRTNMRQEIREKDGNMFPRNPMFSEANQYSDKMYSAEAGNGYMNMRQGARQKEKHMFGRNPALSDDEYSHNMYSAEAGNGYMNMRQGARQKENNMFGRNPALSDDEYSHNMYSAEAGRGYMNMKQAGRQKEDHMYALSPVLSDDEYGHKMYSAEAGRGYMNMRQAARQKEETMFVLNPVHSDDEYGHKMYSAEGGRGYMNMRQAARRKEDNMFALNPVLSDDEYSHKVHSTDSVRGGYPMRQGVQEENMFLSNQGFHKADARDMAYYKSSAMESTNKRKAVCYGPWGGNSGALFDDGVYTGVREIQLSRSGGIVSMKVCYDMDGKAVWGDKNGGSHGLKVDKIVLDYPSEYLTGISGYYGSMILRGPTVLKSLTFHTNKRKIGPFGDEQGISFSSSGLKDGKIVGFSGRIKGWYLESIGIHVLEGNTPRLAHDMNGLRICEVVPGMVREQQWTAEKVHMKMRVNKLYT